MVRFNRTVAVSVMAAAVFGISPPSIAAEALEEIVVTANKRSENLQDVPIQVSAVTSAQLEAAGINSTAELATVIPGLQLQNSVAGLNPHLRGVGTTAITAGNENSIATYVDGVYIASLNGSMLNLANINLVEVDKGPQGTLFGRNATGGIINITTKEPTQAFNGSTSLSYGNYNTVETSDYVSGGIASNLAADLAVYASHQGDGYGTNLATGSEANKTSLDLSVRSKWVYTPTAVDKIMLVLDFSRMTSNAPGSFRLYGGGAQTSFPTTTPPYYFSSTNEWDVDNSFDANLAINQRGASVHIQHDFAAFRLTSISAYRNSVIDERFPRSPAPVPAELVSWHEPEREITQELQLSSMDSSTIKWVGGLYYYNDQLNYSPFDVTGTSIAPLSKLQFLSNEKTESEAAYGQATAPLQWLGDTNVTAGLRYTSEKHYITGQTNVYGPPIFFPPDGVATSGLADTSKRFDKVTWRFSLDHHFNDSLMAYISDNRGFRSGSFNTIPAGCAPDPKTCPGGQPLSVAPEVLDAYEAGLKSDFLGHRLRINTSVFYYDYTNLQVTNLSGAAAITVNGAKAEIYGIDLDVSLKATEYLTLNGGVEILHDRFISFPGAQYNVPNPITGGDDATAKSAAGNKLPYAPDYAFNLSVNYVVPTAVGEFSFNATDAYNSGWSATQDNILKSGAYNLVNAQVGLTLNNKTTHLIVWGKNLAERAIPNVLFEQANPYGSNEATLQPPRTYGIRVQQDF